MSYRLFLTFVIIFLLLAGCSPVVKAPVRSLSGSTQSQAEIAESTYRVKKGDTLYSIAFRYGLNYRGLARRNDISEPFRISIDQLLILSDEINLDNEVINPSNEEIIRPSRQEIKPSAQVSQTSKKPQSSNTSASKQAKTKPQTSSKQPTSKRSQYDRNIKVQQWLWPIASSKEFVKKPGNQLLFKVNKGTNVRAVAAGRVVYSGKGLVGYGHLIIIKHNQNLLSAYAFNDEVMIKEKQTVSAGQKIATVGTSPTGEVGLGFEIRSRGKPINPIGYLR